MNTPLFAVISAVLMIGSFSAGRATAPVYAPNVTAPVHSTKSTNVDITSVNDHKTGHYTVARNKGKSFVAAKKTVIHRIVKKAKTVKKAEVPHKKGISTPLPGKIHASGKVKKPIVLHPKQMAATHFDCTAVPDIAYQYPRAVVVKAAAEYLPKSSLLKLDYCLSKGGSG